jgi:hypothetical protein
LSLRPVAVIVVNDGAHTGLYFVTHGPEGHEFSKTNPAHADSARHLVHACEVRLSTALSEQRPSH